MDTTELTTVLNRPGPFATVVVDVSRESESGAHEQDLRIRAACEELAEQGAPVEVVQAVTEALGEPVHRPAPVARCVVATPEGVAYDDVAGARVPQTVATWDVLPDLARWAEVRDATLPFVLVLVDHEGGDISLWDSADAEPQQESSAGGQELEHVHQIGESGWAAYRLQKTTENVWRKNADEVAAQVVDLVVAQGHPLVLLGGDPTSVARVRDDLADLPASVVELASGQRAQDGGDEALQEAVRAALHEQVVARRTDLAHRLKEATGRGEGAASGVDAVADAFVRGQVGTLLLDPSTLDGQSLDPAQHPGLAFGGASVDGPVPADRALVALAALTDADVAVLPSAALGGEPVAALLRWDG